MKKFNIAERVPTIFFYGWFAASVPKKWSKILHDLCIFHLVKHIKLFGSRDSLIVIFHDEVDLPFQVQIIFKVLMFFLILFNLALLNKSLG